MTEITAALTIHALTGEQLDQAQPVHIETIDIDDTPRHDRDAWDMLYSWASDNGEHGFFRLTVTGESGSEIFASNSLYVRGDDQASADSVLEDIADEARVDWERMQISLVLGKQIVLDIDGAILTARWAEDENKLPWVGYDITSGEMVNGKHYDFAAFSDFGHAETEDDFRAQVHAWIARQR